MANWKVLTGTEDTAQAIADGYTLDFAWRVVYDDRTVEVPVSRYLDTIAVEKHFRAAYKDISDREEVIGWLIWRRLSRHEDANERPQGTFEEWLETVVKPELVTRIDLDEEPVPKVLSQEVGK